MSKDKYGNNQPCPKCGSKHVGGLMQSFYVPLVDGEMKGQFHDYCSETEVGDERVCYDCSHEWVDVGPEPEELSERVEGDEPECPHCHLVYDTSDFLTDELGENEVVVIDCCECGCRFEARKKVTFISRHLEIRK